MHLPHPAPRFLSRLALAVAAASGLALAGRPARADVDEPVPTAVRGGDTVASEIQPAGEADFYSVFLAEGDSLTVAFRDDGAVRGLEETLTLVRPGGATADAVVRGQGTKRGRLTYRAVDTGVHVLRVEGGEGEFTGSLGGYALTFRVRHGRLPRGKFNEPDGGPIVHEFPATDGATVTLRAATRRGSFALTDLMRPDGTPEPGFADALKSARTGRSAKVRKLALTGGDGLYRLEGVHDAGASVSVTVNVRHLSKPNKRPLGPEPHFDPQGLPFPVKGTVGTLVRIPGYNFTFVDVPDLPGERPGEVIVVPDVYPRIWLGDIEVPREDILRESGIYGFLVPAGVKARATYAIRVLNADGQSVRLPNAFTIVPPPVITSIFAIDGGQTAAGPAGGRRLRITGSDLRPVYAVEFGGRFANPAPILDNRLDVVAPPHEPGDVTVRVYDEYGQVATLPTTFPYLDSPSNAIDSIDLEFLQAIGGESVTVTGSGFLQDSKLTLDGTDLGASVDSPTQMSFAAPTHEDGVAELRVTDRLEQTSAIQVTVKGFLDATDDLVPEPRTTTNSLDGWRGTRLLTGDLDGDDVPDAVLLQTAQAAGATAQRSRVRVLLGNADGTFTDVTSSAMPAVSDDEDWRARDGVLVDLDGDDAPDLALVTDEKVEGGARSSLRLLRNDGSGSFTDKTSDWAPALTEYGDVNQGVALAALDVDGANGADLVIAHTGFFTEEIIEVIDEGDPGDPTADPPIPEIPPTIEITINHYAAVRVLLNDGNGALARTSSASPSVSDADDQQYQADAIAVADLDADDKPDLLLTRTVPIRSKDGSKYLRSLLVLRNEGGTFADVSASWLPAPSDPEYLQASRIVVADLAGDSKPDVLLLSSAALASPNTGTLSSGPSLRLLVNSSGSLQHASSGTFPSKSGNDQLQGADAVVGDLDGDDLPDIAVLAASSPDFGGRACRILRNTGSGWVRGTLALPPGTDGDDGRGVSASLVDLEDDGDLDLLILRNDNDESVRNLRTFLNPRR